MRCAFAKELPNLEGVHQDQQPAACSSDEHGPCGRSVGNARDDGKAGEIGLALPQLAARNASALNPQAAASSLLLAEIPVYDAGLGLCSVCRFQDDQ